MRQGCNQRDIDLKTKQRRQKLPTGSGVDIYKRVFARDVWEKVFGASAVCPSVYVSPSEPPASTLALSEVRFTLRRDCPHHLHEQLFNLLLSLLIQVYFCKVGHAHHCVGERL